MNKYQRLIQERFLDNEDAVINALRSTYEQSYKDITKKIESLDLSIEQLQKAYDSIEGDEIGELAQAFLSKNRKYTPEEARESLQSMLQSKIYQRDFQRGLENQVDDVLGKMLDKEYTTIADYLKECYEDGFIGTMFDLQGQGIPLCFPLDQEAITRAVQLDSPIKEGLYNHLGENVGDLKKKIASEVSRGIATGMSFEKIARNISLNMMGTYENPGGSYAYALRIARTEGHRIQCQGAMDACFKAKEKGADVVKQWDSTLDGNTRESHQKVDGEIRELDEKFSNGLMFPGDPSGGAAEVVNCRCALLQRARWAVEGSFTKMNNFTKEIETFDSIDDYNEFKKAFFSKENKQYMNYHQKLEKKYKTTNFEKLLGSMDDKEYKHYRALQDKSPIYRSSKQKYLKAADDISVQESKSSFTPAKTIEEATEYAQRFVKEYKSKYSGIVDYGKIDVTVANDVNAVLTEIYDTYDAPRMQNILLMNFREKKWQIAQAEAAYGLSGELYLNGKWYKNLKTIAAHKKEYFDLIDKVKHMIPDEIAKLEGKKDSTSVKKLQYWKAYMNTGRTNVFDVETRGTVIHEMGHMLDSEVFHLHKTKSTFDIKASMDRYASGISAYATSNTREYVAESFAAYWSGELDILDPELIKIFEGKKK